jgi:hypothetical protein
MTCFRIDFATLLSMLSSNKNISYYHDRILSYLISMKNNERANRNFYSHGSSLPATFVLGQHSHKIHLVFFKEFPC